MASVCSRLRAQMPFSRLAWCWTCHRVSRPVENLHRKFRGWVKTARQLLRPPARAGITAGPRGSGVVQLIKGPPAGTRIVANAASLLLDGDLVRPVEAH